MPDYKNSFALNLYTRMPTQGNLFFSPFSISIAMGMALIGARAETGRQLRSLLGLDENEGVDDLARLYQDVFDDKTLENIKLMVANAFWGAAQYPFKPEFILALQERFGAWAFEADFTSDAGGAVKDINDWVSDKTENLINDIVSLEDISITTRLILVNAIYFLGQWDIPFIPQFTVDQLFRPGGGKPDIKTPMMGMTETYGYLEQEGFQALELCYEGGDVSMVIFVPKEADGLAEFEAGLTIDKMMNWLSAIGQRTVNVTIPKFKLEYGESIGDILASMGAKNPFSFDEADFSGMTGAEKLCIGEVIHKAFVEVNELGTEASAATVVTIMAGSVPDFEEPPVFRADRPFLFLIRHKRLNTILFMGRVVDPS